MQVEISLHCDPNALLQKVESAAAIGAIQLHNGKLRFFISYPKDACSTLLGMLNSKKLEIAVITGTELHRNSGSVRSFELNTVFEPDNY